MRRQEIEAEVRYPGRTLYTQQALDRATAVLDELYAAAERQGLTYDDFRLSGLAGPAIYAVRVHWQAAGPPAGSEALRALVDSLAAALTARNLTATVETERGMPYVAVARTAAMPALGPNNRASIWVGLTGDDPERGTGWSAAVDLPRGGPGCDIVASYDEPGVAAVADVITAFAEGRVSNPFRL